MLCFFKIFSVDFTREKTVTYSGSDDFHVNTVSTPKKLFDWTVKITGDNNLCYYNDKQEKIYVTQGTKVDVTNPVIKLSKNKSYELKWVKEKWRDPPPAEVFSYPEYGLSSWVEKEPTYINFYMRGNTSDRWYSEVSVSIIEDGDYPVIKIDGSELGSYYNNQIPETVYFTKDISYSIEDETSGVCICNRQIKKSKVDFPKEGVISAEDIYSLIVEDLVGHRIEQRIVLDKTPPVISVVYKDEAESREYSGGVWINKDLYVDCYDETAGLEVQPEKDFYNESGVYPLYAKDKAGYETRKTIKIDKELPVFTTSLKYDSVYDTDLNNYKSLFTLNIENICDAHSGIARILVSPTINGNAEEKLVYSSIDEKNKIENQKFIYEFTGRDTDNNISFIVTVTDHAGNTKSITLGGEDGYFVPAAVFTDYEESEKNRVKVNFYSGNTDTELNTGNYQGIKLQRHFSLTDKDNQNISNEISETSFGSTEESLFNESVKQIWKNLTVPIEGLSIIKNNSESYYEDYAIEGTGFTHKNVSYDCIYEYANPVGDKDKPVITETICNATKLALSNNKGRYSIRVRGEEGSYIVIDDNGTITEGSTENFKMPDSGVVKLAIKVEDPDIEQYQIQLQGYVELTSENGKFKLQETDTDPVGTEGATAGCGKAELRSDNKNVFISLDKPMDGNWVELGDYALQYNITTVFAVELTEGFAGNQEEWSEKNIRVYAASPAVLGGKAKLVVGDAGSYNEDGITARPWQPIKMEIVPASEGQSLTELIWDFGNGKTSKDNEYGDYRKNSNSSFENIRYDQNPERTGALSEYKLKITDGADEAEFKINIIDTQFGFLYGNEVWRGEHIIKKEITVPSGVTLQIGDTAHSEYDSDITCLCVGKISEEEKGGITVEEGGTLILDEGNSKTIRFVQAGFKDDIYFEAADEEKSWQNMWKGIAVKGVLKGDRLDLRDAECGLTVFPGVSIEFRDSIKMDRCKNGILMNGAGLKAKEIEFSNCSGYGIKLNSKVECEKFIVTGSGRGFVLTESGSFTAGALEIKDCITGLHLLGGNLKIESGIISGCSEYGIKADKAGSYNYDGVIAEGNERNIYVNGIIR